MKEHNNDAVVSPNMEVVGAELFATIMEHYEDLQFAYDGYIHTTEYGKIQENLGLGLHTPSEAVDVHIKTMHKLYGY